MWLIEFWSSFGGLGQHVSRTLSTWVVLQRASKPSVLFVSRVVFGVSLELFLFLWFSQDIASVRVRSSATDIADP